MDFDLSRWHDDHIVFEYRYDQLIQDVSDRCRWDYPSFDPRPSSVGRSRKIDPRVGLEMYWYLRGCRSIDT